MPIRFRCQHCQQLMGIARRKAGTEVQCPTCRHSVVVPPQDEVPAAAAPKPAAAPAAPLFEHSDFDEVLRGGNAPQRSARPAPKSAGGGQRLLERDSGPAPSVNAPASVPQGGVPPDGFFISSNRATLLAVAGIVALALAFGAGLLVGRYCLGG